jgi:hypothetical protein
MKMWLCVPAIVQALVAGCSGPTDTLTGDAPAQSPALAAPGGAAAETGGGGFYPLEIGNRWHYDRTFSIQTIPDGGPPGSPYVLESEVERRITGEAEAGDKTYRVQETRIDEPDGSFTWFEYYRQTREELLFIDPPVAGPSRRAEPASLSARLENATSGKREALEALLAKREAFHRSLAVTTRFGAARDVQAGGPVEYPALTYPLHPKLGWVMRPEDDPFLITRLVEGVEVLHLEIGRVPAWRIRHDLPGIFGPNDVAWFWYNHDGFLGYRLHAESEWTDPSGERRGVCVAEEAEMLDELDLVRPGE